MAVRQSRAANRTGNLARLSAKSRVWHRNKKAAELSPRPSRELRCRERLLLVAQAIPVDVGVMKRLGVRMFTQPARSGDSPGTPAGS